jgi:tetratricopeptide (TPR) repeat protein
MSGTCGEYAKALPYFMAFSNKADSYGRPEMAVDARNRIADCYYIRADYPSAISYYDKVIDYGKTDADYAMFQKGFAQGLNNNNQAKITTLTGLIRGIPVAYVSNALFERGRAYVAVISPRGEQTSRIQGMLFRKPVRPLPLCAGPDLLQCRRK